MPFGFPPFRGSLPAGPGVLAAPLGTPCRRAEAPPPRRPRRSRKEPKPMAIYHLSVSNVSRASGSKATATLSYISGQAGA